jgi:hypothetical protein
VIKQNNSKSKQKQLKEKISKLTSQRKFVDLLKIQLKVEKRKPSNMLI